MDELEMAQMTVDLAWDIVSRVDNDPRPGRGAIHRINWARPNPRFAFTASGLMLCIDRTQPYLYELLTPWGVWKVTDYSYFTAEAIADLLVGYDAEEVPEADVAYRTSHGGSRYWSTQLYAIRRFGDMHLPAAVGTPGLATGYAVDYPVVLEVYPEDYQPYWNMVRRWQSLSLRLDRGKRYYERIGLDQYRGQADRPVTA